MDNREYSSLLQVVPNEPSTTGTYNVWKRKENGVSTPHVLIMRPYAHIIAKHAKKGIFSENMSFDPF